MNPPASARTGRRLGDIILFVVTAVELAILLKLTPSFTLTDWIYVSGHILVFAVALTRQSPRVQDHSMLSSTAVVLAYGYPYAQVIYLNWSSGTPAWPEAGLLMVSLAAALSLASLIALGRFFGVRPALRGLSTSGPYRFIRHPMYFSYMVSDIGYNLQEWNRGTVLLTLAGWGSLLYRIHAEERMLAHDDSWPAYAERVRYRLLPGIW